MGFIAIIFDISSRFVESLFYYRKQRSNYLISKGQKYENCIFRGISLLTESNLEKKQVFHIYTYK